MATADWSYNLIRDMEVPQNRVIRSELAVVIRDKYPKAQRHFLVLPWKDIDDVYQLTPRDVPLLKELERLGERAAKDSGLSLVDFRMGFHMKPAMHRLHLHVISQDFVSPRLRTKEHYTCFTTELFMPLEEVLSELASKGKIERRSERFMEKLFNTPLKCNQCSYQCGDNMRLLKDHLGSHFHKAQMNTMVKRFNKHSI